MATCVTATCGVMGVEMGLEAWMVRLTGACSWRGVEAAWGGSIWEAPGREEEPCTLRTCTCSPSLVIQVACRTGHHRLLGVQGPRMMCKLLIQW